MSERPCTSSGLPLVLSVLSAICIPCMADEVQRERERVQAEFRTSTLPFLQKFCLDCHGSEDPAAKLDLSKFRTAESAAEHHQTWEIIRLRVASGDMPPKDDAEVPNDKSRASFVSWIESMKRTESQRRAGDPGAVLVRRLSNEEYNNSIRDLTGVDIRPTRTFPVDPANEAGFDNSGESLMMSPALLQKYLDAAREVSDHLVLRPQGISFAPHKVTTDTDRDKYCVKRIVQFYERQPVDISEYLLAAWQQPQDREQTGGLSPKYLAMIRDYLGGDAPVGPGSLVKSRWQELAESLAPSNPADVVKARREFQTLAAQIQTIREQLSPQPSNLNLNGSHVGSQPFVLWKNDQYAAGRRTFARTRLKAPPEQLPEATTFAQQLEQSILLPEDSANHEEFYKELDAFCSVFPDAFFISERGRDYVEDSKKQMGEKGRLLSAGFHSMMGYYRDDAPLYDMILSSAQQKELDLLWQELDFVASAPMRQYVGFLWFERTDSRYMREPQFDFARPENKDSQSPEMIERLTKVYLERAVREGGSPTVLKAIEDYFHKINDQIRSVERWRKAAEEGHLKAVIRLANRAWRRPLTTAEQNELREFYHSMVEEGATHEEATQDTLVSVLMSPLFNYRVDLLAGSPEPVALSDIDLASRLSFFLWSSLPDQQLIDVAVKKQLTQPDVLKSQLKRMIGDSRVRGFVTEFTGNWLDYRRFEEHNSVDRKRFPQFTDELRTAMFEEPVHFFQDLLQRDGQIEELLTADHTFVSPILANHYGVPVPDGTGPDEWFRVRNASQYGRGGLLPMSVFLTKNAPGLRTSPVKRGYWVVRRVLGEHIPAPPPNVPDLPEDESALGDLTLTQVLARHRDHKACAGCHNRFDAVGIAFEGFGPVGERRTVDLGGRPVSVTAEFPGVRGVTADARTGDGIDGLRHYLVHHRREEFVDNFCRKLLSYALGRTLILPDDLLVEEMKQKLAGNDGRISAALECIVTSPQFLTRRGR